MTKRERKSGLEKLVRSRRVLRIADLLATSSANDVLDEISRLPGLQNVVVVAHADDGMLVRFSGDSRAAILMLTIAKSKLIDDFLYPPDEEDE